MRKILFLILFSTWLISNAKADTIIIMDDNNNIKQQIYTPQQTISVQTAQTATTQPVVSQPVYVTSAPLPPQQVIVTRPVPPVVVVRETPIPRNYYYDSAATSFLAGFTGAVVGNAVFRPHHHHHHHPRW